MDSGRISDYRAQLLADPLPCYPPATVACFEATCGALPRRELDEARNRIFLERLARTGVPALLIAASTGEGHLRNPGELQAWFANAASAEIGDTRLIALLRPEDGLEVTRDLALQLRDLNYAVAFLRPGNDLLAKLGSGRQAQPTIDQAEVDQAVVVQMAPFVEMLAEVGLPVGVYSIPDVSGVQLTAEAAARLVDCPGGRHIVAAKITEADYEQSTARFFAHPSLSHLKIVQGWDPHLARALREGHRVGVTSGAMSFAVFQYQALFAAAERADWDELARLQTAVTALFASMQDDPARFAALQRAKYVMGLGQPLTDSVSEAQAARLLAVLAELPRTEDRRRLARSLNLMDDGPFAERLRALTA